jgi:hypothetical protein
MQGASLTVVVGKGQEPNENNLNLVTIHPSIDNGGALAATGSLRSRVASGGDSLPYRRSASLSIVHKLLSLLWAFSCILFCWTVSLNSRAAHHLAFNSSWRPSPTVCRLLVYFCSCFSVWKSITQRELIPFSSLRPKLWTKYTTGRVLFYLLSRDQLQLGRCMQLSDCSIPVARECVVVWTFVRFVQTD